jgi:hypothetical protein
MAQHKKRWWPYWLVGGALILLAGVWLVQSLIAQPDEASEKEQQATTNTLDVRPHLIDTNDAYIRYIQTNTGSSGVGAVQERDIFYAQDVDWNNDTVVALKLSLFSGNRITAAGSEKRDGKDADVSDALEPSSCRATTQDQTTRLIFIKQSSRDTSLPVILRTTPNTASCDTLQ